MPRDHAKAQLWADRFLRFRRSGQSISQFCRDENISIQAFSYWRDRIGEDSTTFSPKHLQFAERSSQRRSGSDPSANELSRRERQVAQRSSQRQNRIHHDAASLVPLSDATLLQQDSGNSLVRFTIEARGIKIACQSESPEAILAMLDWAASQPTSGFQQLIVRD